MSITLFFEFLMLPIRQNDEVEIKRELLCRDDLCITILCFFFCNELSYLCRKKKNDISSICEYIILCNFNCKHGGWAHILFPELSVSSRNR